MILGTDFRFSIDEKYADSDTTPIELMTEIYRGVVFRFTQVAIREEDDTAKLKFAYEILDSGKYKAEKLKGDKFFELHLGLILNTLILDTLEIENANGEGNSEVLDAEREVQP